MTTVLFIHGTGVREPEFAITYGQIQARLAKLRDDIDIQRCYWGGIGAELLDDGASFYFDPDRYRTRRTADRDSPARGGEQAPTVPEEEIDLAWWARLVDDPLYEVRLRELERPQSEPVGANIANRIRALRDDSTVAAELAADGLTEAFDEAVGWLLDSAEFDEGFGDIRATDADNERMLARALIARCLATEAERGVYLPGDRRDQLVAVVQSGFGVAPDHSLSDVTDRLGSWAKASAARAGSQVLDWGVHSRRRSAVERFGDVVYYQANGAAIRQFVRDRVLAAPGPVVLLGHSLGGVIAFDLLAALPTAELAKVRLLVTVGSQVPLLYELNALSCGLKYPTAPADGFPPWVNMYDPHDLLAYGGKVAFPRHCSDVAVNTKNPFPLAHGAYFYTDRFYQELAGALRAAGL
jgi:pimeloyl-ACP methyl ester carboxylesterase